MPPTAAPPEPAEYKVGESTTPATPLPAFRESLQKAADKAAARRGHTPDTPSPDKPDSAPDSTTGTPPAAAVAPAAPAPPAPGAKPATEPKQLREAYDKLSAERDKATARLKELEESGNASQKTIATLTEKISGMEGRLEKLGAAEERAKSIEAEHEKTLERLRIVDYTQHPEFHNKYVKPVAQAVQEAKALIKELVIEDPTTGNQRAATDADFSAVLRAPNLTEATRRAKELFGPDFAQMIVGIRNNIIAAERAREQAIDEAALRSKEAIEREQLEAEQTAAKFKTEYEQISQSLLESDEGFWRPDSNTEDKDAASAYAEGSALADETVAGNPKWTAKERLAAIARVRHRAASFPVVKLQVKRLTEENAQLKARLAEFEKSEPTADGGGRSPDTAGTSDDPRARRLRDLAALANKRR